MTRSEWNEENPYRAPLTEVRPALGTTQPRSAPWEAGFWLVFLSSPFLVFGGLALGRWLFSIG
jgi:hypothetical protein